jgi:hypothetical protein
LTGKKQRKQGPVAKTQGAVYAQWELSPLVARQHFTEDVAFLVVDKLSASLLADPNPVQIKKSIRSTIASLSASLRVISIVKAAGSGAD